MRALLGTLLLVSGCTCAARHDFDAATGWDAMVRPDGGRDAGHDAGVDAAPPPDAATATNCYEAIHSVAGAPCAFDGACLAGDLCCSASATCWDGRVSHASATLDCPGAPRPTGCEAYRGSAVGDTPLGPIDFSYAFTSFTFAFAVDVVIVLARDEPFAVCDGDRLAVWLVPRVDEATGEFTYVGVHDAVAQLVVGGELVRAPATVDVSDFVSGPPFPRARIAGALRIDAPDWNVRGDFDAEECPELDRSGP